MQRELHTKELYLKKEQEQVQQEICNEEQVGKKRLCDQEWYRTLTGSFQQSLFYSSSYLPHVMLHGMFIGTLPM